MPPHPVQAHLTDNTHRRRARPTEPERKQRLAFHLEWIFNFDNIFEIFQNAIDVGTSVLRAERHTD